MPKRRSISKKQRDALAKGRAIRLQNIKNQRGGNKHDSAKKRGHPAGFDMFLGRDRERELAKKATTQWKNRVDKRASKWGGRARRDVRRSAKRASAVAGAGVNALGEGLGEAYQLTMDRAASVRDRAAAGAAAARRGWAAGAQYEAPQDALMSFDPEELERYMLDWKAQRKRERAAEKAIEFGLPPLEELEHEMFLEEQRGARVSQEAQRIDAWHRKHANMLLQRPRLRGNHRNRMLRSPSCMTDEHRKSLEDERYRQTWLKVDPGMINENYFKR